MQLAKLPLLGLKLSLLILIGTPALSLAQIPQPINPPEPLPTPIPIPQPSPPPPLEVEPPVVPPTPEELPGIPDTIIIERFEFIGNTAYTDAELAEITAEFVGREITFAELLQAEAAVTQFYTESGFVNSGAIIPAGQNLIDGVITIRLLEGGLEEINVTGTGRLRPSYVSSRIAIATKTPLNVNRLLTALQLLQLDPLIENISAELAAGSRPELSVLTVTVTPADPFSVDLIADNGRIPSVGSFRRGLSVTHLNLLGFGDRINTAYTNTDGSDRYDINYTFPINARNGTIRFDYYGTNSEVIEEPFDRLDITGDSDRFGLTFRQPIYQTPIRDIAVGLTLSRENSQTTILGEEEPLSVGAEEDGSTKISAIRLFQEYTQRTSRSVLAARSQFSLGVGAFDATINDQPPDSRFFNWRGQGQYVRLLAPDTLLVVRSDIQLSTRALVPLEQFPLGGYQSVRGYRQDVLLTDNGVFFSAEVLFPIARFGEGNVLQIVPFFDVGRGWNIEEEASQENDTIAGAGLGVQLRLGDRFNARIDYGIPFNEVDDRDENSLQEAGVYFSVTYTPF
ncbi:ShlB/FhaC/HecB family hemolysin secretion/activation protein [Capilliphycus salinus ALCB114379]|uniref:ShlB/FhaC/HecB family hemolysin secretion/activation protein n=1 Tax=Capilliphycus salinus TaxID=2768948 RepID=UPI0039A7002C